MRKLLISALLVVMMVGATNAAFAWDGKRKGFILGIGLGPGFTSFNQSLKSGGISITSDRQNELSFMSDFKIGYAPNNLWQIHWMSKISWFGLENAFGDNVTIANGFGGVGATYSFYEGAPSPFLSGGIGFSTWATPFEEGSDTMYGFGIVLGGGYEFSKHWSLGFDLLWGKPSKDEGGGEFSTNALSLKFTINVLAY